MQHTTKSHQRNKRAISYPALVRLAIFIFVLTLTIQSQAQWDIEDSHTSASLRGIASVGDGVAWASGTTGTILRTEDGGYVWQLCAIPPGATKLDFRGIQAFDANTAIVMSSGKGDLSRLYKTTDGCQSWHEVIANPEADGFWDALRMIDSSRGILIGDPAHGGMANPVEGSYFTLRMRVTADGGDTWVPVTDPRLHAQAGSGLHPLPGESFFAASNSSLTVSRDRIFLGTSAGRVLSKPLPTNFQPAICAGQIDPLSNSCGIPWSDWTSTPTPISHGTLSSGIFSLASGPKHVLIAVGGDFKRPNHSIGTAAYTKDDGQHWTASRIPPHGYRSSVAYDTQHKLWITVGPNGTDISRDDGRNWVALKPAKEDAADADKNWNALSLPFVVGPNGRIGKLRPSALNP